MKMLNIPFGVTEWESVAESVHHGRAGIAKWVVPIRTAPALPVTTSQRSELQRMAVSSSLPHRQVRQAKALLWAADGVANQEIARRCEVDSDTVRRWRARFDKQGVAGGGVIAKGRGRKPELPEGTVAEIVRVTCQQRPPDTCTH